MPSVDAWKSSGEKLRLLVQMIHIIRHGESEYNAATASKDLGFGDPQIYDPKLTAKGRRQVRQCGCRRVSCLQLMMFEDMYMKRARI